MKKMSAMLVALLGMVSIVVASDFEVKLDGHVSADFATDQDSFPNNSLHAGNVGFDLWPILTIKKDEFSFVLGANLTDIAIEDCNWLKNAFVQFSPTDNWDFKLGRISTTGIMLTQPLRFLETVRYQHCPIGIYSYGLQVVNHSGKWTTMWDVTTNTDTSFQVSDAFDGLETGVRIEYKWNDNWTTAGNIVYGINDEDVFAAADVNYTQGAFGLHVVGYANDENTYGLYSLAKYQVCKPFEVHVGFDWEDSGKFSEIIGVRLFANENTDLTLDYIHSSFPSEDDNTFAARWRYSF